jgi:hypothetical protein
MQEEMVELGHKLQQGEATLAIRGKDLATCIGQVATETEHVAQDAHDLQQEARESELKAAKYIEQQLELQKILLQTGHTEQVR